jgi:hypothetical protein
MKPMIVVTRWPSSTCRWTPAGRGKCRRAESYHGSPTKQTAGVSVANQTTVSCSTKHHRVICENRIRHMLPALQCDPARVLVPRHMPLSTSSKPRCKRRQATQAAAAAGTRGFRGPRYTWCSGGGPTYNPRPGRTHDSRKNILARTEITGGCLGCLIVS